MGTALGLRTVIYPVADVAAAKEWWTNFLGHGPYFDEVFYVGFEVAGYELGLVPAVGATLGATTYWGVADVEAAIAAALARGATLHEPAADVGEGIVTGAVHTPQGSLVGFIHNPHFARLD